jgi:hypothetical protein
MTGEIGFAAREDVVGQSQLGAGASGVFVKFLAGSQAYPLPGDGAMI